MVTRVPRAKRIAHEGERGLTLVEMLISIAILAVIGGVIASAFSVSLALTVPGGPETRLLGANDLMELEQALGQDGARAACIQVPGGTMYGSCTPGKFGAVGCPSSHLCFGWPQVSDSSCHVADYTVGASTVATRTEYKAGSASPLTSGPLARQVPASISIGAIVPVNFAGESLPWVRSMAITVAGTGVTRGPSQTLVIHPIATDPGSASSQITAGGPIC